MSYRVSTGRASWTHKFISLALILATVSSAIVPWHALAAEPAGAAGPRENSPSLKIRDTALDEAGRLWGKVVDRQGQPLSGSPVVISQGNKELARTVSNANGDFAFGVNRGGMVQLSTTDDVVLCRMWTKSVAPPSAQRGILLCSGDASVRGQCNCNCNCAPACGKPAPTITVDELRQLAPELPEGQYAAFLRADVVITNPDHYSVVIAYDPATGNAVVVAKAVDEAALQLQRAARAAGIPVVQNPALARALYDAVAVGGIVPANLLGQVTGIINNLTPPTQPAGENFQPTGNQGGVGGTNFSWAVVGLAAIAIVVPVVTVQHNDAS